ncbi:hypothetical protein COCSADRAFT_257887 [Bipolaris sorokiniana ND90Pr]|uniref:Uncharacterized protein n=1 Tax=Cochliobolus sativus (strain ND90Pr / ATCC 201652) TaxID=665912 RepID=M2SRE5_COCSN|nr:uncharacterized protein COCSADRAFT_257887 [Bipolaris sorokiniana ND90Pr]EMD59372.1 hypothetical protein COCSADRAFT_257887 [Bipolaris sorokiniana ND90Pr]
MTPQTPPTQWASAWSLIIYVAAEKQVRGVRQRGNKSDKNPDGENSKDVDLCQRMANGEGRLQLHGALACPGTVCRARYPDTRSRILRPQRLQQGHHSGTWQIHARVQSPLPRLPR